MKKDNEIIELMVQSFFWGMYAIDDEGYFLSDILTRLPQFFPAKECALFEDFMKGKGTGIHLERSVVWKQDLIPYLYRAFTREQEQQPFSPRQLAIATIHNKLQEVHGRGYYEEDLLALLEGEELKVYDTIMFGRQQTVIEGKVVVYRTDAKEVLDALTKAY